MQYQHLTRKMAALCSTVLLVSGTVAYAYHENGKDQEHGNQVCPVAFYNGVPMDVEFGAGTQKVTHCLQKRHGAQVVVAIDSTHPTDKNGVVKNDKANFLSNIDLMIVNYEQVHGMKIGKDITIIVVASSSGGLLMTKRHKAWGVDKEGNPLPNPFAQLVQKGLDAGMKFYLCQMAARELGIKKDNVLDGVEFVTGGQIAVADLQMLGYAMIKL